MDIQKPYSREQSQVYSYPVTEHFEYSAITSAFECLLGIDQLTKTILSLEPHSIKLLFKVKKLVQALKGTTDPFSSFFSYLPPSLKQDLTPFQVISIFAEDFAAENTEFFIRLVQIPVSKLLAHTGRPQEVFEKLLQDKPKLVAFELVWDMEVSMECVAKLIKCVPGNLQAQGFLEISGLIVCAGSYYSSISKAQENWKSLDKFSDKEPLSWVKIAWMLISSMKYPSVVVYQRVEGYKSTANFITSLDFENLLKFAKRQDERVKVKARSSDAVEGKVENKDGYLRGQVENKDNLRGDYKEVYSRGQVEGRDNLRGDFKESFTRGQVEGKDNLRGDYKEAHSRGSFEYKELQSRPGEVYRPQGEVFNRASEGFRAGIDAREGSLRMQADLKEAYLRPSNSLKEPSGRLLSDPKDFSRPEPYTRPVYDSKDTFEPRAPYDNAPEDPSRKSSTPLHHKFDYLEAKSTSFDTKLQGLNPDRFSYKSRFDIQKPEDHLSPKAKEDSFRSWDRHDEMERIHLGSPKDKDPPPRAYSRQEEVYPKQSYTPQRSFVKEAPRFTHYSPKDSEGKIDSSSPYFREKLGERLLEMGREEIEGKREFKAEDGFRAALKFKSREGDERSEGGLREDSQFEVKRSEFRIEEAFRRKELPPRAAKGEGYGREAGKASNGENDESRRPYESLADKYKYLDGSQKILREEFKVKRAEEALKRDEFKFKPYSDDMINNEKFRSYEDFRDDKEKFKPYADESSRNEGYKLRENAYTGQDEERPKYESRDALLKGKYQMDQFTSESYKSRDVENERFVAKEYRFEKEKDYRTELKAKDLEFRENEPLDIQDFSEKPVRKFRSFENNEILERFKQKEGSFDSEYKNLNEDYQPKGGYEDFKFKSTKLDDPPYEPSIEKGEFRQNFSGQQLNYRQIDLKSEEIPKKPFRLSETELVKPNERSCETSELSSWSCTKCNKSVAGTLYECSDCRLINWDQFYKVKSLQHSKPRPEECQPRPDSASKDDNVRRLYSFSDKRDEENAEWVCGSCNTANKSLFFLCKSCRKPRMQNNPDGRREKESS